MSINVDRDLWDAESLPRRESARAEGRRGSQEEDLYYHPGFAVAEKGHRHETHQAARIDPQAGARSDHQTVAKPLCLSHVIHAVDRNDRPGVRPRLYHLHAVDHNDLQVLPSLFERKRSDRLDPSRRRHPLLLAEKEEEGRTGCLVPFYHPVEKTARLDHVDQRKKKDRRGPRVHSYRKQTHRVGGMLLLVVLLALDQGYDRDRGVVHRILDSLHHCSQQHQHRRHHGRCCVLAPGSLAPSLALHLFHDFSCVCVFPFCCASGCADGLSSRLDHGHRPH